MIEVEGVTKRYGKTAVVDDVTFAVPRGGVTALVGANGAGKSTLLSVIGRTLQPSAGHVRVDGMDVRKTPSATLARRLSFLRQESNLAVRLTVRELVEFGRFPYSSGRLTGEDLEQVQRAIDYLDLQDFASRPIDNLSGGQRQRAFIAMVLCQDTDYVLLDEPLNNLDMRHAAQVMTVIHRMAVELQKTVLVVLHDVNFAASYADRIIAMTNGRLAADGAPADIMTPDVLNEIFGIDVAVRNIDGNLVATYFSRGRAGRNPGSQIRVQPSP